MKFLTGIFASLVFISSLNASERLCSLTFLKKNSNCLKNALTTWYTEFIIDEESSMVKLGAEELEVLTNVVFLGTVTSWLEIQVRSDIRRLTYLQWQLRKQAQTYEEKQQRLTLLSDVIQRLKPLTLARTQAIKNLNVAFEYLEDIDDENLHHALDALRAHIKGFICAWLLQTHPALEIDSELFKLFSSCHHELNNGTLHLLTDDKKNDFAIALDTANYLKDSSEALSAQADTAYADVHEYTQGMFALSNQMYRFYYHFLYKTLKALDQQPRLVFDTNGFIEADNRLPQQLPEPATSLTAYINQLISDATLKIETEESKAA